MELRNKFYSITNTDNPKFVYLKLLEDGEVLDKENFKLLIGCLESAYEYLYE